MFLTSRCTMDRLLRTLFAVFFLTTVMVMYLSFCVNTKTVKSLIDWMQHTYDELKDEDEIAIIEKYGNRTKRYTIGFTVFAVCALSSIMLLQLWPRILDVVFPVNKTRPIHQIQFFTEYIGHRERYLYFIMLHANATICIASFVMLGTATMMMAYYYHICGMFRIASYRIQYAMRMNTLPCASTKKEILIYKHIVYAVDIHREAMQLSDYFMSKFSLWFSILIGTGVLSTSLSLMQIFQTITSGYIGEEFVVHIISLFVMYLYMFMANYVAQEVTDHNNHLFATVYNVRWYIASVRVQRIILFLLQRGTKPFTLRVGGIFVASLEGFSTLTSATISYFTLMYSTRQ